MAARHSADECLQHCVIGTALDGMCVGLVVTNPATRITWMNRSAEKLLGTRRQEALGQLLGAILKDPRFAAFWRDVEEDEGTVMDSISIHWPKAAELKVNATRCLGPAGEDIGRALLFCDVSRERSAQVELSRELADHLLRLAPATADEPEPHHGLTPQELQILRLVGDGLGNEDIAARIGIAPSTLRTHLKHVYRKTGLRSRAEAVRYALRNGLS